MQKVIVGILFLLFSVKSEACSCSNTTDNFFGTLYHYVHPGFADSTAAVVEAEIIGSAGGYGVKLKIINRYYVGKFSLPDTMIVWGDPGWCCRANLSAYYHATDTIIAIIESMQYHAPQTASESTNDSYVFSCDFAHIKVKNDSVFGGHVSSFTYYGFPLSAFLDSLNNSLSTLDIRTLTSRPNKIKIYPNPVKDWLHIDLCGFQLTACHLQVINSTGQIVIEDVVDEKKSWIDVGLLKSGVYELQVRNKDGHFENVRFLKE